MKYHQIEAFYQVMLTGSITQAAQNLGRTQPAVSMTIATLEDGLGAKLFDRHAGRISPRAEAHMLFDQIRPVMQQLQDIRTRFNRLDGMPVPRISVIASGNPGMHLVPSVIAGLAAEGQSFRLMSGSAALIVSEMQNQRHDIAVLDRGTEEIDGASNLFDIETFHVSVCAVYRRGLLPEHVPTLSVDDLAGHQICALYAENLTAQDVRRHFDAPRVEFESIFPMACYAVANGAVAIVDSITCSAMQSLTEGALPFDWRPIREAAPAPYYLLRSRYRPRSQMTDRCHAALRDALCAQQEMSVHKQD